MTDRIKVLVRIRPQLPRELLEDVVVHSNGNNGVIIRGEDRTHTSSFDRVFDPSSSQADVYTEVSESIAGVMQGYNTTVFAYGQTGTGKTYTMLGGDHTGTYYQQGDSDEEEEELLGLAGEQGKHNAMAHRGIIPRAVEEVFKLARARQDEFETTITCGFIEIYNERVHDLLQPYKEVGIRDPLDVVQRKAGLQLREDGKGRISIPDLIEVKVNSTAAVLELISRGTKHRTVRQTEMNEHSSRSHSILQLFVEQRSMGDGHGNGTLIQSKLNLVDLAGSERWGVHHMEQREGAEERERIGEMTSINLSLSTLATVIAALSSKVYRSHIPYRDSKLTHLLQDSLGGNCKTTVIATVSPSTMCCEESCSTLKFADRARNIQTTATINAQQDSSMQINILKNEVARLRKLLHAYVHNGAPEGASDHSDILQKLEQLEKDNKRLTSELEDTKNALKAERGKRKMLVDAWKSRDMSAAPAQLPQELTDGLDSPMHQRTPGSQWKPPPARRNASMPKLTVESTESSEEQAALRRADAAAATPEPDGKEWNDRFAAGAGAGGGFGKPPPVPPGSALATEPADGGSRMRVRSASQFTPPARPASGTTPVRRAASGAEGVRQAPRTPGQDAEALAAKFAQFSQSSHFQLPVGPPQPVSLLVRAASNGTASSPKEDMHHMSPKWGRSTAEKLQTATAAEVPAPAAERKMPARTVSADLSFTAAPTSPAGGNGAAEGAAAWGRKALLTGENGAAVAGGGYEAGGDNGGTSGGGGGSEAEGNGTWGRKAMLSATAAAPPPREVSSATKKKPAEPPADMGSWIYILGKSASSAQAKKMAALMTPEELAAMYPPVEK